MLKNYKKFKINTNPDNFVYVKIWYPKGSIDINDEDVLNADHAINIGSRLMNNDINRAAIALPSYCDEHQHCRCWDIEVITKDKILNPNSNDIDLETWLRDPFEIDISSLYDE